MSRAQTGAVTMGDRHTRVVTIDAAIATTAPPTTNAGHSRPSYSNLQCARDRVRAAIYNTGARWPDGHLTLTSTCPDIYRGTADLAIAVAVLAAAGTVTVPANTVFIGELALDGRLRRTAQIQDAVLAAHVAGFTRAVIPADSLDDAAEFPESITVLEADTLATVMAWLARDTYRYGRYRVDRPGLHGSSPSLGHLPTSSADAATRKANRMPKHTNKDLAVRLMSVINHGMEHGEIDWNCRSFSEVIATSGDPTHALDPVIEARERDSGQHRDQFMPDVYKIVDRMLAGRLTFGPDHNPTYYIGTVLDGYVAADAPLVHLDDPVTSDNEISLSITEPSQCGTVILSGRQVDALIAGLIRWRTAHPDRDTVGDDSASG